MPSPRSGPCPAHKARGPGPHLTSLINKVMDFGFLEYHFSFSSFNEIQVIKDEAFILDIVDIIGEITYLVNNFKSVKDDDCKSQGLEVKLEDPKLTNYLSNFYKIVTIF